MKENERNVIIAVIVIFLILFLFGGFGFGMYPMMMGGMMYSTYYGGFGMLFGWIINLLILAILILGIVWLVKQIQK